MGAEPTPYSLLKERQDEQRDEIDSLRGEVKDIPVLRKEVAMLSREVERNTSALVQGALAIVSTGVLGLLVALILKGVIG